MEKYAIYRYSFTEKPVENDLFDEDSVEKTATSDEKRREWLDRLFGNKNAEFTIRKSHKIDAPQLPCKVIAHTEKIVLLRLVNPKQVTIWQESEAQPGVTSKIDKRKIPSSPFIYIVIDCREGKNLMAIEIDTNVWRSTDIIADLLSLNINMQLEGLNRGFGIKASPATLPIDFLEHSYRLIKKDKMKVTKLTIHFTRGKINPRIEEIIKNDAYLKDLYKRMFEARDAELTYNFPNGNRIVDGRSKMLEHFVMLIASEPNAGFRISISYDDGSSYACGKDIRMEFLMNDTAFLGMLGVGCLFPEQSMGAWFDYVANEIRRNSI